MFLSDEEASRRLNDPRNLLSRVDRAPSTPLPAAEPDAPVIPDIEEDLSESIKSPIKESASSEPKELCDPTMLLQLDKIIANGDSRPGRKPGIRNRTVEENGSIGLMSHLLGGSATEKLVGVDPTMQHIIKDGYTSSVQHTKKLAPKDELLDEIYSQGREVTSRAFKKLITSLDLIDDPQHRLQDIKDITKLVGVAKGLSGIVKDMTPKEAGPQEGNVHFHIYAPERNTEDAYEVVEVGKDGAVTVSAQQ